MEINMTHQVLLRLLTPTLIVLLAACSTNQPTPAPTPTKAPPAKLANPASVYCEEHGGKLELKQDASGGVVGMCRFPDKSECEEWAFMRGECKPGDSLKATPAATSRTP